MIGVTERAKRELKRLLSAKVGDPQEGLRLITSGSPDKFTLSIDIERLGDQVVKYKGSKVLLVERDLATRLEGRTFDFQDTADGPSFVVLKER